MLPEKGVDAWKYLTIKNLDNIINLYQEDSENRKLKHLGCVYEFGLEGKEMEGKDLWSFTLIYEFYFLGGKDMWEAFNEIVIWFTILSILKYWNVIFTYYFNIESMLT